MNKQVVVAFGGVSPEHEVSVLTAMQAIDSLKADEMDLIPLYITKSGRWLTGDYLLELEHYQDLDEIVRQGISCSFTYDDMGKPVLQETGSQGWFSSPKQFSVDVLIPAFHGSGGENGAFQGVCETFNIPYAGSEVLASSVGMNKVLAKQICRANDIPVTHGIDFYEPDWERKQDELIAQAESFGYPLVIKPVNLGSSIGVARATDREALIEAVETAFRYDANILVEQAVTPLMEINCSVLGTFNEAEASVCERPLGKEETLSFEDKYQSGEGGSKGMASADREIPADIPAALTTKIQNLAIRIFSHFRASGVARLDFLVNADDHQIYFNEINTIPGSFSFYLWEESGMEIRQLMLRLIAIAEQRFREKTGRVLSYETNLLNEKAVHGIKGLKGKNENGSEA